jgi:DNA-binding transcriptional ArsR family regulator
MSKKTPSRRQRSDRPTRPGRAAEPAQIEPLPAAPAEPCAEAQATPIDASKAEVHDPDCRQVIEQLPAMPESAATVLCTLDHHKPMTGKDLREATGLPRRTLYTAIQKLKEVGVLHEQVSLRDSRQTYFWVGDGVAAA